MKKCYLWILLLILLVFSTKLAAAGPTKADLQAMVRLKAVQYEVSAPLMERMITCESGWNYTQQSKHIYRYTNKRVGIVKGTREESWGLVQINLHWNPKVTKKQATDPNFAINYLARELAAGRGHLWSCFPKPLPFK